MCTTFQTLIPTLTYVYVHPNSYPQIRHHSKMSMFDEQYEYQLYIHHYSCVIHFYNRDRGLSFCYRDSISKCFTPPYIFLHYGFITINSSRLTGPRCDKYLSNIVYSSIKHKHLAFNNLNTRVKLSNSLSDTHFLILFFRPTSFISIH